MLNARLFFISGLFAIFLSVLFSDLLLLIYNGPYPVYFSFIALLYVFGYIIVVFSDSYLKFKNILYLFIVIKSYIFIISFLDYNIADKYFHFLDGDANHYHIPAALQISSFENIIPHLLSSTFNFNGRLTHVFLFIASYTMPILSKDIYFNIALNAYLINFIFNILTLLIIYKTVFTYFNNRLLASKAVLFIALNPFFLYYSCMPQKEALIFLSLSMLCYFLVSSKYKYLLLSSLIFLFERPYMIVLTFMLIFFLTNIQRFYKVLVISFGFMIVEIFLGINRALSMHSHYLTSMKAATESFLPFDNFIGDILRIFFSPFMLRPFLSTEITDNIFYGAYYLSLPIYIYLMLISLIKYQYQNKLILIGLIFIWFVAPFHGVLKLTILTFLSVLLVVNIKINFFEKIQNKSIG
jgi:hypothetical protein